MTAPAPESWPVHMAGAEEDPHGTRAQAAQLIDSASEDLAAVSPDLSADQLPPALRGLARQVTETIGEVRRHVHTAAARLDQLADDDLIPDRGRERLTREAREAAERAVRDADARAGTALDVLEAGLTATTQPTFPAGADRAEARERFKLLADASNDAAAVVRELVGGSDDELAAIAASPFARTYLQARGVPADVIATVATFAAQAALTSGDPTREAAARGLLQLDTLRKARMKAVNAAHFVIGWQG